jgi:hypothetical protein
MVQQLSDEDHRRQLDFCLQLQDLMSSNDHFLEKVPFSDEATFHVLWGYVKNRVVVPPLPRYLAELKARIIAAVKIIDALTLTRVARTEYRVDMCRATRGAHIDYR